MKLTPIVAMILLLLSFSIDAFSQTPVWGNADNFTYDVAGNRILRFYDYVIVSKPGTTQEEKTDTLLQKFTTDAIVVKAYPNPTTDMLIIENQNWKEGDNIMVMIYDMTGRLVLSKKFFEAKENVSLRAVTPGTYQVNYFLNEKLLTNWQIIKF